MLDSVLFASESFRGTEASSSQMKYLKNSKYPALALLSCLKPPLTLIYHAIAS